MLEVELSRVDLAQFFCEDLQTFKLEDCFKILHSFIVRWNQAAVENKRRKQLEEEARQRKKIREEQFQKRLQLGWETPQSVENFNNTVNNLIGHSFSNKYEWQLVCDFCPLFLRTRLWSLTLRTTYLLLAPHAWFVVGWDPTQTRLVIIVGVTLQTHSQFPLQVCKFNLPNIIILFKQ